MRPTRIAPALAIPLLLLLWTVAAGTDGTCVPVPVDPVCATDADCPAGEVCVDGVCEPAALPCTANADCPVGEVCVGGLCEPAPARCLGPDLAVCPEGEACQYDPAWDERWGDCYPWDHRPICLHVGSFSEGWYWADTGELIDWAFCEGAVPVCEFLDTRSEGWYVWGQPREEGRIAWDFCAPRCDGVPCLLRGVVE